MNTLVDDVRTALVAVRAHRGKKVFRLRGRTVSTLAHVEQAALLEGMSLEDFALLEAEAPSPGQPQPLKGNNSDETSLDLLFPGSAVLVSNGTLPALGEGSFWSAPGNFQRFLELAPDDSESASLCREILLGPARPVQDGDDCILPGYFMGDGELQAELEKREDLGKQLLAAHGELSGLKASADELTNENAKLKATIADLEARLGKMEAPATVEAAPDPIVEAPAPKGKVK